MSRKFRPVPHSSSGMYSVRGSELARTGNSNPQKIRCVVELLDDSEYIVDLEVSTISNRDVLGGFIGDLDDLKVEVAFL